MSNLFGYIRVSTAKQGTQGVSLQEQRDAIVRYAARHSLDITEWFEERETAAKRGRRIFNRMLKLLQDGKAEGVVIHKIDRSARNLKDWADLGELIDRGIDVHFVNETLDLRTRGGRLSADIQAVVAADYIRNLREETLKGFYGRLKQGLYPLPAPLGYLDRGKGKPKEPNPVSAPLVRKAFELYASGRHTLDTLGTELFQLGLRNRKGGPVTRNGLSVLLNNPFYMGLIRLRRGGETFEGVHEPLISKSLFDRAQQTLSGKYNARSIRHDFLFRRLLTCKHCDYSLIGETRKGYIYYRCHTRGCPTTTVREEVVDKAIRRLLVPLQLSEDEQAYIEQQVVRLRAGWAEQRASEISTAKMRLQALRDRLARLTDAYVDGALEKDLFEERKAAVLQERKDLEEKLAALESGKVSGPDRIAEFLGLAKDALDQYELAIPDEKREFVRKFTSDRLVDGRNPEFTLVSPFQLIANRFENSNGDPYRDVPRTLDKLIDSLAELLHVETTRRLTAVRGTR